MKDEDFKIHKNKELSIQLSVISCMTGPATPHPHSTASPAPQAAGAQWGAPGRVTWISTSGALDAISSANGRHEILKSRNICYKYLLISVTFRGNKKAFPIFFKATYCKTLP